MKIVQVDNFDRDTVSDILMAEKVSKNNAEMIVKALNEKYSGNDSPLFFRAESDDYKLHEWKP